MNDELETIELDLEENNDLSFKVSIQGATQKPSAFRLICEADEMSFGFNGKVDDEGNVAFVIPAMKKHLSHESIYSCAVEVLIEGRFFRPIKFDVKFKQPMKCVVESINVKKHKEESVNVIAEISKAHKKVEKTVSQPIEESFTLQPTRKLETQIEKKMTLREKMSAKPSSITGLDEKTMDEVAKSTMARLIAMDFRHKSDK